MIEFTDSASARAAMKLSLGEAKIFELQSIGEKKKKQQPTKKQNKKDDNCHTSSCSEPEDGRIKHKRLMHLAPPPPPIYPPMHIYQPHPYQGAIFIFLKLKTFKIILKNNCLFIRKKV